MKMYHNEVAIFSKEEIDTVLEHTTRQYLQGNLKKEQELPFVHDSESEIGISYYKEFTHDDPHYHDVVTETNYILQGKSCLKMLDTGEEFILQEGDVFSIPPKRLHIMKVLPNTKVLFFKNYSINDKHSKDIASCGIEEWLKDDNF